LNYDDLDVSGEQITAAFPNRKQTQCECDVDVIYLSITLLIILMTDEDNCALKLFRGKRDKKILKEIIKRPIKSVRQLVRHSKDFTIRVIKK